jgi:hypothetical protein
LDGTTLVLAAAVKSSKLVMAKTDPKVEKPAEADYYFENGFLVFTGAYHQKRGFCCGNGCRHCPYTPKHRRGGRDIDPNAER